VTPLELTHFCKQLRAEIDQLKTRESGFSAYEARLLEFDEKLGHLRTEILDLHNKYKALNARMGKKQ
jgi:hypothetical protein